MSIWKVGKDKSSLFGRRYDVNGEVFELVSQNDLNVPYFVKVVNGMRQKREYVVPCLESQIEDSLNGE